MTWKEALDRRRLQGWKCDMFSDTSCIFSYNISIQKNYLAHLRYLRVCYEWMSIWAVERTRDCAVGDLLATVQNASTALLCPSEHSCMTPTHSSWISSRSPLIQEVATDSSNDRTPLLWYFMPLSGNIQYILLNQLHACDSSPTERTLRVGSMHYSLGILNKSWGTNNMWRRWLYLEENRV